MKIKLKIIISLFLFLFLVNYFLNLYLLNIYHQNNSKVIKDRNNEILFLIPNEKDNYAFYRQNFPEIIKKLVIKKEDKFFYYHLGLNPVSLFEYLLSYIRIKERISQSTISQQLVKIILDNEDQRSILNKITEIYLSLVLELFNSKEKILTMYLNSVYLGNNFQGFHQASLAYFNKNPEFLTIEEISQLVVSISNPNSNNPSNQINIYLAKNFLEKNGIDYKKENFIPH
ncbi:MAG: transglycosylase domain-containing protein, partial [Patescibacteria group bacterium]|nr:transglycosylase domain-containing protein [Patescibacteria group bacterium]